MFRTLCTRIVPTVKFAVDINSIVESKTTNPQVKLCLMERLASWSVACSSDPGLAIIPNLYNGIVFNKLVPYYDPSAPIQYPAIQAMIGSAPTSPTSSASPSRAGSMTRPPRPLPIPKLSTDEVFKHVELVKNHALMLTETISFTDPDTVTSDELSLIKEFYKRCMELQRETQVYLSEITSKPAFDDVSLGQLLHANEDLVNAFKCHTYLMEKLHKTRSYLASHPLPIDSVAQAPPARQSSASPTPSNRSSTDDAQFKVLVETDGAGVGSGYRDTTSDHRGFSRGKTVLSSSPPSSSVAAATSAATGPAFDPFADDSYFVAESESDRVAAVIRNGKRPVLNEKEEPMSEQEWDLIQLIKAQSLAGPERLEVTASSSSSSSAPTTQPVASAALQVAAPVV
ncbi:hypothetical protein BGX33_007263 [Mortierella sp. NVP41]|nr:hypothetical protein BGX33_007263 [Mortierella sp. NVP41]